MNGEPSRYRKIPVVVEAMQYGPYTAPSLGLCFFLDGTGAYAIADGIIIPTLEGYMLARPGDWIIKGVENEFYPCKPDIFAKTYEPVTGKEVMPSEPIGSAEGPRNTAPAGTDDAGGGAGQRAVQPVTVRLVFSNADATPKTTVLDVSAEAVPDIMAWYGAYCAGDRYTVTVDGRNVPMDQNGEPAHVNETPKSEHVPGVMLTPATKGGDA